jgi:hypothetical protein
VPRETTVILLPLMPVGEMTGALDEMCLQA